MKRSIAAAAFGLLATAAQADITVASFNDYIDPQLIKGFEAETGVKVSYQTYETDAEAEALLKSEATLDVIVPSTDSLPGMIKSGDLRPFDSSKMEHFFEIDKVLRARLFTADPALTYSVPYFWGRIGIAINKQAAEEALGGPVPKTWGLLFNPQATEKLQHCGISVLDSREHMYTLLMQYKGRSLDFPTSRSIEGIDQQLQVLRPFYRSVDSADYLSDMPSGKTCVAMAWEGDGVTLAKADPNIEFFLPEEGTVLFMDAMAIPARTTKFEEAKQFIAYMMRPDVASQNAEFTHYNSPFAGIYKQQMSARGVGGEGDSVKVDLVPIFRFKSPPRTLDAKLDQAWQHFVMPQPTVGETGKVTMAGGT